MVTPDPETDPSRPPVAQRKAPAASSARPAAGVSRETFDKRMAALEEAIGAVILKERLGWLRRVNELERRLDEREARDADRS